MYQLYHDKEKSIIEVKGLKKVFQNANLNITDEPYRYNQYYYFCKNRKALVEMGRGIKEEWLKELKASLEAIERIKI
ncbi:hypothetical protein IFU39_00030 [Paenibacillus sp. CFBP 13594]|uniref:hypothetical protein n=1 Tax=Paenibacillus sp. CFBP 13594 TaxID=2774037 RepID=UPI0017820EA0|nr:hypothetical protein [Paenibacillus sp. CFBP 13594]MBD8836205.1 hypothetical protein [Paenibacillus sp. CFBP 13594]